MFSENNVQQKYDSKRNNQLLSSNDMELTQGNAMLPVGENYTLKYLHVPYSTTSDQKGSYAVTSFANLFCTS